MFKKNISSKHSPAYFSDLSELSKKIQQVIIPTYRSGVKALNLKNNKLTLKISELETEIEKLNGLNRSLISKPEIKKESLLQPLGSGGLSYTNTPKLGHGIDENRPNIDRSLIGLGRFKPNK